MKVLLKCGNCEFTCLSKSGLRKHRQHVHEVMTETTNLRHNTPGSLQNTDSSLLRPACSPWPAVSDRFLRPARSPGPASFPWSGEASWSARSCWFDLSPWSAKSPRPVSTDRSPRAGRLCCSDRSPQPDSSHWPVMSPGPVRCLRSASSPWSTRLPRPVSTDRSPEPFWPRPGGQAGYLGSARFPEAFRPA